MPQHRTIHIFQSGDAYSLVPHGAGARPLVLCLGTGAGISERAIGDLRVHRRGARFEAPLDVALALGWCTVLAGGSR